MIQKLVEHYMSNKNKIEEIYKTKHPEDYKEVVKNVIDILSTVEEYGSPDPERIHVINDGDYQGTLLYIIGAKGYQPDNYWFVKVGYGSCSGCDTLESIRGYQNTTPNEQQIKDYMTLSLHIIQGLKAMDEDVVY